jgi:CRP-like cAMP-binding protein
LNIINDESLLKAKLNEFQLDKIFDLTKQIPFRLYQYNLGDIVLYEGMELQALLFLVEGKVKVTSSVATGKSLLLRFSKPFSIIGDIELIRDVTVQSQVEAVGECLFIGLPIEYIKKYERDNTKLLHILLEHLSYKLQTCTTASRVNLLASVENRFASYLLATMTTNSSNEFGIELKTSNSEEIANLLGTTHRHLNRVINSLTEKGVIERNKNFIHIVNWDMLELISDGIRYE